MTKCPNCGAEVPSPAKSWPVTFKKPGEPETQPPFCVGIFECTTCNSKFRARVKPELTPEASSPTSANVAGLVDRINNIREGLTQTLKILQTKIRTLETERSSLLDEMGELKRTAELRAATLEIEVGQLRDEIKSMRELLGAEVKETA